MLELMISLGIGLAVVALVGTLYANNSDIFRFQRAQGEAQEKARYVLGYLRQNLQQMGYHRDGVSFVADAKFQENAVLSIPQAPKTIQYRYQKIPGFLHCASQPIQLQQGEDPLSYTFDLIYIGPSVANASLDNSLYCLATNVATSPIEIAQGIWDMQFKYGVDTTDDKVIDEYMDPSGMAPENWLNVHAISVCLLVGSDTKLPLVKKGMQQVFTDCNGNSKSSEDFVDQNGFSPVLSVVRTTIYLANTPK
ncbi:MAG: PilW family protein [Neisseriaceae bacterium]|nr:PilW family protein [Neisseriaceae bacterium]